MSVLHALVTRTSSCGALVAAVTLGAQQPTTPKVPFGNSPCASLSAGDQTQLKVSTPVTSKPDRAPAKLAADNMCTYTHGGSRLAQGGYMTKMDYDSNNEGNRSTSKQAPTDLPGAFAGSAHHREEALTRSVRESWRQWRRLTVTTPH